MLPTSKVQSRKIKTRVAHPKRRNVFPELPPPPRYDIDWLHHHWRYIWSLKILNLGFHVYLRSVASKKMGEGGRRPYASKSKAGSNKTMLKDNYLASKPNKESALDINLNQGVGPGHPSKPRSLPWASPNLCTPQLQTWARYQKRDMVGWLVVNCLED